MPHRTMVDGARRLAVKPTRDGLRLVRMTPAQILEWKSDPANVKTDKVQKWDPVGTSFAYIPLGEARALVTEGKAKVVSSQAIQMLA